MRLPQPVHAPSQVPTLLITQHLQGDNTNPHAHSDPLHSSDLELVPTTTLPFSLSRDQTSLHHVFSMTYYPSHNSSTRVKQCREPAPHLSEPSSGSTLVSQTKLTLARQLDPDSSIPRRIQKAPHTSSNAVLLHAHHARANRTYMISSSSPLTYNSWSTYYK